MNYQILHSKVGPFLQGRVVSVEQLEAKKANVDHLIAAGAIAETDAEITKKPLPLSPLNPSQEPVEESEEGKESEEAEEEASEEEVPSDDEIDWAAMSKADLFAEAKRRGKSPTATTSKAQLIALITE